MNEVNEYIKERILENLEKVEDTQALMRLYDIIHYFCEETKSIKE